MIHEWLGSDGWMVSIRTCSVRMETGGSWSLILFPRPFCAYDNKQQGKMGEGEQDGTKLPSGQLCLLSGAYHQPNYKYSDSHLPDYPSFSDLETYEIIIPSMTRHSMFSPCLWSLFVSIFMKSFSTLTELATVSCTVFDRSPLHCAVSKE